MLFVPCKPSRLAQPSSCDVAQPSVNYATCGAFCASCSFAGEHAIFLEAGGNSQPVKSSLVRSMKSIFLLLATLFGLVGHAASQSFTEGTFKSLAVGTQMRAYVAGTAQLTQDIHYQLHVPKSGAAPYPAVVIAHGSGGVTESIEPWKQYFLGRGFVVAIPDSYRGRISGNVLEGQSRLHAYLHVVDVVALSAHLKADPRIDPHKIVVIGFSRGGMAALNSAFAPFYRPITGQTEPFSAHIAFYPACNYPYLTERFSKAPVLVLMGSKDDYTPSDFCVSALTKNKSSGLDVRWEIFQGGYHGLDTPAPATYIRNAEITARCPERHELDLDRWEYRSIRDGTVLTFQEANARQRQCTGQYFGAWNGSTAGSVEWSYQKVGEFLKALGH